LGVCIAYSAGMEIQKPNRQPPGTTHCMKDNYLLFFPVTYTAKNHTFIIVSQNQKTKENKNTCFYSFLS
jgi:hypothetical protein